MLGDADVYEGLWEKYNQPVLQRWKWTLGNLEGYLVLGCLGLLLAFSQSRCWVVLRYLVLLRKKSIRLDGDTHSDPLEHLSQMDAVKDVVPFIRHLTSRLCISARRPFSERLQRQAIQPQRDSPIISPLFGVTASLNAVLFVAMSVAIPCFISEGTLGAPVVKSRMNGGCLEQSNLYRPSTPHDTDAVFQLCNDYGKVKPGCGEHTYLRQPKLVKTRTRICPFPGNICYNNTDAIEITHKNIKGYDIGINTKSRIVMNHRLTCSPVHLDSFLLHNRSSENYVSISVSDTNFHGDPSANPNGAWRWVQQSNMTLRTLNGPNRFSNESSGNPTSWTTLGSARDITVLPTIDEYSISTLRLPIFNSLIHSDLRRQDGISFLVIYRAGGIEFASRARVDDPFFAAHTTCHSRPGLYCPDQEATALGCLDQAQFCIHDSEFCTPWGAGYEEVQAMWDTFKKEEDFTSMADIWAFSIARDSLSLYRYLGMRQRSSSVPLNTVGSDTLRDIWRPKIAKDQWVTEVETWFARAITQSILEVQIGPRYNSAFTFHLKSTFPDLDVEYSTCSRILFRNANHTNINWLEFWTITGLLVLICVASYAVKWLDNTTRATFKYISTFIDFLGKRLSLATSLLKSLIRDWPWRKFSRFLDWIPQRRTWHSGTRQAPEPRTESIRYGLRGSVRGSDYDDLDLTSVSISLDQLGSS